MTIGMNPKVDGVRSKFLFFPIILLVLLAVTSIGKGFPAWYRDVWKGMVGQCVLIARVLVSVEK